ncbi:hypothetical protein OURE66S_00677 [Oligella ureolytica]
MPNNIQYHDLDRVIPPQRLDMFKRMFGTSDNLELYGAYLWSIKAATSLAPLISVLEVALRNSIHISASNAIGKNWYEILSTRIRNDWKSATRDKNNINWHHHEVKRVKQKIQRKTPPANLTKHDLLIAKMDFGFWINLLRACFFDNSNSQALWPKCIPTVFPGLSKGHTNMTIHQKIEPLRELRNDIAHNAPVWKHSTVRYVPEAISYLNGKIDDVLEILSWLSEEKVNWIEAHMVVAEARRIISMDYLHLCQQKTLSNQYSWSVYKRQLNSSLRCLEKNSFDLINYKNGNKYMVVRIN